MLFRSYKLFPNIKSFGKYYASHLNENQTGKVEILVGAFMVMEKETYDEVGGFDEDCFMYSDDIDLSYMVLKTGKQNYYFHETTVIHYKGESTIKDGTYMKRFQEAMNFFYKKHFKTSFFFSLFMKIGIIFFSFVKMFQGKSKPKSKPESYILVSENDNTKEKLQEALKKNIEITTLENQKALFSQTFSKSKLTEVILDNNYLTFNESIEFLETQKYKNMTFKILPSGSNFIIGSNSSNDRGEVIKF